MNEVIRDPLVLICACVVLGKLLGKLKLGHFSLGGAAILFVGILMTEALYVSGITDIEIPSSLFNLSLNAFVTVVALNASSTLIGIIKKYGLRFALIGFVVRGTAALIIFICSMFLPRLLYELSGVFVGALTCSPGFGNALEIAKTPIDMRAEVTTGYIIAYLPAVITVITYGRIVGGRYKKSLKNTNLKNEKLSEEAAPQKKSDPFSITKLALVMAVGMLIGIPKISLAEGLTFSLGGTGGSLISALFFGCFFKGFNMEPDKLTVVREIAIAAFLAIIGLNYGHKVFESLFGVGLILIPIAIALSITAISVGFLFGKYVLKIDTPILAGAVCGAMTSTPGLASTLESFGDPEVVTGYGATYPFGLIFAIIFINLLI